MLYTICISCTVHRTVISNNFIRLSTYIFHIEPRFDFWQLLVRIIWPAKLLNHSTRLEVNKTNRLNSCINLFCKLALHIIIIVFYCYKNIISTFSSCPFTISHLGLWGKKNMPTPWMRAGTPDKPNMYRLHCTKNNTVKLLSISLAVPENIHAVVSMETILNLRNRTGEERRRQTLCDKRDNNFVWKNFRRTSPSVKQIFSYKTRKHWC